MLVGCKADADEDVCVVPERSGHRVDRGSRREKPCAELRPVVVAFGFCVPQYDHSGSGRVSAVAEHKLERCASNRFPGVQEWAGPDEVALARDGLAADVAEVPSEMAVNEFVHELPAVLIRRVEQRSRERRRFDECGELSIRPAFGLSLAVNAEPAGRMFTRQP